MGFRDLEPSVKITRVLNVLSVALALTAAAVWFADGRLMPGFTWLGVAAFWSFVFVLNAKAAAPRVRRWRRPR